MCKDKSSTLIRFSEVDSILRLKLIVNGFADFIKLIVNMSSTTELVLLL